MKIVSHSPQSRSKTAILVLHSNPPDSYVTIISASRFTFIFPLCICTSVGTW